MLKNWLLGAVLFLVIILPWHIAMYKEYGYEFLREYFIKHHFERFVNSAEIGRKQPFWFFVPVFALAFMPWILTFLASLYEGVKDYIAKIKNSTESSLKKFIEPLKPQDNVQALLLFSTIYFVVIFGVLSISSTKLPSYILPVLPPAAILTAWIWNKANPEEKNWKYIAISTEIIAGLFILVAIGAIFAFWFLPFEIKIKLLHYRDIAIFGLLFVSLLMLLKLKYKKTMCVFATYILLMVFIMSIAKMHVFNTMYSFGQNELVKYAQFAKDNNAELVAFDFAVKPSMLTVYDKKINYIPNPEFDKLQTVLETSDKPVIVIFKIKNLKDYKDKINPLLKILIEGDKYSMYKFR